MPYFWSVYIAYLTIQVLENRSIVFLFYSSTHSCLDFSSFHSGQMHYNYEKMPRIYWNTFLYKPWLFFVVVVFFLIIKFYNKSSILFPFTATNTSSIIPIVNWYIFNYLKDLFLFLINYFLISFSFYSLIITKDTIVLNFTLYCLQRF